MNIHGALSIVLLCANEETHPFSSMILLMNGMPPLHFGVLRTAPVLAIPKCWQQWSLFPLTMGYSCTWHLTFSMCMLFWSDEYAAAFRMPTTDTSASPTHDQHQEFFFD